MRNFLFLALALTTACKWTDFDDLEETTWVRSTQDPDIGSSDYAVAIAGVSTGTSGGTLAVVSADNANFSTIAYNAKGKDALGANPVDLGMQHIGVLAEVPVFTTDAAGHIGLVDRSVIGGNFAVVFGSATAPNGTDVMAMSSTATTPDAAVFLPNGDFVFAAGSFLYSVPATGSTAPSYCAVTDSSSPTPMPLQVAAMASDGADHILVWTKSGSLISYPVLDASAMTPAGLAACLAGTGSLMWDATKGISFATNLMPAPGAQIHVVGGFAILTAHPTTSRSGSVFVVNLTTGVPVTTTPLTVEGLHTSTVATFGTDKYLVLGVPDRSVDGVAAGEVDLYAFNSTSGALEATPSLSLHDAQPESGHLFGRTLTTMNFNGSAILVVGADSEVYAYYRTALYDNLP